MNPVERESKKGEVMRLRQAIVLGVIACGVILVVPGTAQAGLYHGIARWEGAYPNKGCKAYIMIKDATVADSSSKGWAAEEMWTSTNDKHDTGTTWIESGYTKGWEEADGTYHTGRTFFWVNCISPGYPDGYYEHYLPTITCALNTWVWVKIMYDGGTTNTWGIYYDGTRWATANHQPPNSESISMGFETTSSQTQFGTSKSPNKCTNMAFYRASEDKWYSGLVQPGATTNHAIADTDGGSSNAHATWNTKYTSIDNWIHH
jgi:hypothetical protein